MVFDTPVKTSASARPWPSQVETFVEKMPLPRNTGDNNRDSQIANSMHLLKQTVQGCLHDPNAILKVHGAYADFVRQQNSQFHKHANPDEQFLEVGSVSKCDQEFLFQKIIDGTDIEVGDYPVLCKNAGNFEILFEAKYQLSCSLKMLNHLQIKDVMSRFLKKRWQSAGRPLENFKLSGGLGDMSGRLLFREVGSYKPCYANHKLVSIVFRNGDSVQVDGGAFADDVPIRFNFSDWRACFPNGTFGDLKLHLFFKESQSGPYALDCPEFSHKSKKYGEAVEVAFEEWNEARKKTHGDNPVSDAVRQAREAGSRKDADVLKKRMHEARAKGLEAMKKRRESSDVLFNLEAIEDVPES